MSNRVAADEATSQISHRNPLLYLALGALGVVYGDIGTSPLYAFRESFHESHGIAAEVNNVLGVLSLIFWALVVIISIKYLIFVLRADNQGEGGILALASLLIPKQGVERYTRRWGLILLGIFGTALLYGSGMITPAISVLSAIEGLEVATPFFEPYIIPITIVIIILLFLFQSQGAEGIGKIFGPITFIWFLLLAALGFYWILRQPSVLAAMNPLQGVDFFVRNGWQGFLVLGSVFLVVTGGDALYADIGHFGKRSIRLAWFTVALPALLLNYFGQGALLIEHPEAVGNPFYQMVPTWALYPVVIIATLATVIASQALITGAFSLTMQAMQLGYLPRFELEHTSSQERGQIYISGVNWLLMISCIALVLTFQSSSNLAAAYGVAVTSTMVITTILLFIVQREIWKWPLFVSLLFLTFFLVIDLAFLGANLLKIPAGGWFPLVIALIGFTLMTTWKRGRSILANRLQESLISFEELHVRIENAEFVRVPGTAVYMSSNPSAIPPALAHNLEHNKALHEFVIFLSVVVRDVPRVAQAERITIEDLRDGFHLVCLYYGFMEQANVPRDLNLARLEGLEFDALEVSYFLGRERILASSQPGMPIWREHLFSLMSRNSRNATDFFRLPPDRVVELGAQVEI
jgi:KUP system potassium uptake protein